MKKSKIIAGAIVTCLCLGQIMNVQAYEGTIKLIHKPFWMFGPGDADRVKNLQLGIKTIRDAQGHIIDEKCESGSSFTVFDDYGNVVGSHKEDGCENTSITPTYPANDYPFIEEEAESSETDDFLNDLFGDDSLGENTSVEGTTNDETDDFLNDLFGSDTSSTDQSSIFLDDGYTDSQTNSYTDFHTDPDFDENDEVQEDEGIEDVDDFLNDLFGKAIKKKLYAAKNELEGLSLKGKALSQTLKNFAYNKEKLHVANIEATVLSGEGYYNAKVAALLHKVNADFKIDSIKNDFAKNISAVSYSLSTYLDSDISGETREVFRKKLISDLQILQKKYKVLKKKDAIISKTLEKRGAL